MVRPLIIVALFGGLCGSPASADEVNVAVASNFAETLREIAGLFEERSGHRVVVSSGSTGKLFVQIEHGAPHDIFLAADTARPLRLERSGVAVAGRGFVYATGRLALWSKRADLVDGAGTVLRRGAGVRLALANPETAPYGAAAREVLTALGLWELHSPRAVRGENVSQVYQFVASGNADLGFVAYSQIVDDPGGSSWIVPQELFRPIEQRAVLLARSRDKAVAIEFLDFLRSGPARRIIAERGYRVAAPADD